MKYVTFLVLAFVIILSPPYSNSDAQSLDASPENEFIASGMLESNFDNGDEGWLIYGDAENFSYHMIGGNPGGFISADDQVSGEIWYFVSPDTWGGDWNPFLGGTISYDLKLISGDSNYHDVVEDVFIVEDVDAGNWAKWTSGIAPILDTWKHYEVTVSENNFEIIGNKTWDQIISNVSFIVIRGEYIIGPDTEGIDNVRVVGLCEGDFEPDRDVDGADLAALINSSSTELNKFAEDFGRVNCI
jgi:hypothetical protein